MLTLEMYFTKSTTYSSPASTELTPLNNKKL